MQFDTWKHKPESFQNVFCFKTMRGYMLLLAGFFHLCKFKYLFKSVCFKKYHFVEWLLTNLPYSAIHFQYDLSEWELLA